MANSIASEFVDIYIALSQFAGKNPPAPFSAVVSQAITTMAPLAAHLLIQEKFAAPAKPPETPGAVQD